MRGGDVKGGSFALVESGRGKGRKEGGGALKIQRQRCL